jgi:hypothetical protein
MWWLPAWIVACDARTVSFFDELPASRPEPAVPEYRPPEWVQAPENVMPAAVALDAVIVCHDGNAVWIADALVYPNGLKFTVVWVRRDPLPENARHQPLFMSLTEPGGPQFGVAFADGRKTALGRSRGHAAERPDIVLSPGGGGGSERRWSGRMWLWPLPPPGPIALAFAWPALDIPEATIELSAEPIIAAADRAVELWPDTRPLPSTSSGGWTADGPG